MNHSTPPDKRGDTFSMKTAQSLLATLSLCMLAACQSLPTPGAAQATLTPKSGSAVTGTVTFTASGNGLVVVASLKGLTPNAEHGFHVHEKGDCSAPDAMSAAGHFNPSGASHGAAAGAHHAGDMPNLRADAAGNAQYRTTLTGVSLEGPQGVLGRSVVVHRDPDDYKSQPAGNSGPRIACGVIQR